MFSVGLRWAADRDGCPLNGRCACRLRHEMASLSGFGPPVEGASVGWVGREMVHSILDLAPGVIPLRVCGMTPG